MGSLSAQHPLPMKEGLNADVTQQLVSARPALISHEPNQHGSESIFLMLYRFGAPEKKFQFLAKEAR